MCDFVLTRLCFELHAAELPHHELASAKADPPLPEEYWPASLEFDRSSDHEHQWRRGNQADRRQRQVGGALQDERRKLESRRVEVIGRKTTDPGNIGPDADGRPAGRND